MIDLNEFTSINDDNRAGLTEMSYLKMTSTGLYLKVGRTFRKQFTDLHGHKCNVLFSPDFQRIVLAFGDARTLSTSGEDGGGLVAINTIKNKVIKEHGTFDRFYFDVRWDEDGKGHKVLVFTHNGKVKR